jgi:hypothetical protein
MVFNYRGLLGAPNLFVSDGFAIPANSCLDIIRSVVTLRIGLGKYLNGHHAPCGFRSHPRVYL